MRPVPKRGASGLAQSCLCARMVFPDLRDSVPSCGPLRYPAQSRVMLSAFRLTAPDDALPNQGPPGLCHHRPLAFRLVVRMKIDHDPVEYAVELMSPGRVGIEHGELPGIPLHVKHRQPCLALWVETARRDIAKPTGGSLLPIRAVDVQKDGNAGGKDTAPC